MARQFNLFFIALGFFTRIPVPKSVDFSEQHLNHASRYFALVGLLVGACSAVAFALTQLILPLEIALLLAMLVSVLITGCFHEDGLADVCDGFGGGWTAEQKLQIMKDSRLGTYGAVSIWFVLSLKFYVLLQLSFIIPALLIGHCLSRGLAVLMIQALPYAQIDQASKVKPLAKKLSNIDLIISVAICTLVLAACGLAAGAILLALIIIFPLLMRWQLKNIGGFSGDTLGATQQISELVCYLVLLGVQLHQPNWLPEWFSGAFWQGALM